MSVAHATWGCLSRVRHGPNPPATFPAREGAGYFCRGRTCLGHPSQASEWGGWICEKLHKVYHVALRSARTCAILFVLVPTITDCGSRSRAADRPQEQPPMTTETRPPAAPALPFPFAMPPLNLAGLPSFSRTMRFVEAVADT